MGIASTRKRWSVVGSQESEVPFPEAVLPDHRAPTTDYGFFTCNGIENGDRGFSSDEWKDRSHKHRVRPSRSLSSGAASDGFV